MRWVPWFTVAAVIVFAVLPQGQDLIEKSISAGEQLARTMNQLVLMIVAGIAAALAVIEVLIRYFYYRRKHRQVTDGR